MSSFFDMISAFIAMLMSAAFLHFGAAGDSRPDTPPPSASHTIASAAPVPSSVDPVVDDSMDNTAAPPPVSAHKHARRHCHAASGAPPMLDTVRTPSPVRRG